MIKEVDLLSYLPPLVQDYYEMQKITAAENPEFQLLWEANKQIRNNIFILTATEQGLKRFEKLLGIYAEPDDLIESRRDNVFLRWTDSTPYSFRYLINLIAILTNGNFEIYPRFSEYAIEIVCVFTTETSESKFSDSSVMLRRRIPAHLVMILRTAFRFCSITNQYSFAVRGVHRALIEHSKQTFPARLRYRAELSPFNTALPTRYDGTNRYNGTITWAGYRENPPYLFPARSSNRVENRSGSETRLVTGNTVPFFNVCDVGGRSITRAKLSASPQYPKARLMTTGKITYNGKHSYNGAARFDGKTAKYEL